MSEIGSATFGLVVGMGRFKAGLADAKQEAKKGGEKIGEEIVDESSKEVEAGGSKLKSAVGAMVAAAGVGGVIAMGISDSLEKEALGDKLAAQLNLNPEQAAAAGRAAGNLYADAYGDSLEQVNDAVGAVWSTLGDDLGPAEDALERATGKALDLATAFGVDVQRAVSSAGILISSGLARDVDHAFDLMAAGMQEMPAHLREELLEATDEYGQFFSSLGISGERAFGMLTAAASDGMYGIDKTGDALKELTIRATDMSATSVEAYEAAGLGAESMSAAFLAGGDQAADAFTMLIEGLLGIEDPVLRANSAIALFGAPIEDLGTADIPKFLGSLTDMGGGLGEVEGRMDSLGDTLNDNAKTKLTAFSRSMRQNVSGFIDGKVLPAITSLPGPLDAVGMGFLAVGGAGASMLGDMGPALLAVKGMGGPLKTAATGLGTMGKTAITSAGQIAMWGMTTTVNAAKAGASMLATATMTVAQWTLMGVRALASAAQMAAAWLISIGPVLLVGAAIAGLVALVVIHWDTIKNATAAAWDWVFNKIKGVADFLVTMFMNFTLPGLIIKHWDTIKNATGAAWDWVKTKIGAVVDWFKGIPAALASAGSGMWDFLKGGLQTVLNTIVRGLEWMVNQVVNALNKAIDAADVIAGPWVNFDEVSKVNLPRVTLHRGGIVPGRVGQEIPTLLKAREGVFTQEQMRHLAPVESMSSLAMPYGGGGYDQPLIVYVDGKRLFEVVRDRQTDLERRKHGGGRTRRVA